MTVIDNAAPCKAKQVEGNTQIGLMEKYLKNLG